MYGEESRCRLGLDVGELMGKTSMAAAAYERTASSESFAFYYTQGVRSRKIGRRKRRPVGARLDGKRGGVRVAVRVSSESPVSDSPSRLLVSNMLTTS